MDLSGLPSMPPDARASDRIRQRCHHALAAPPRHSHHGDRLLFAAAAAYLVAAIHQALLFLS
jgi:hypothetical protein